MQANPTKARFQPWGALVALSLASILGSPGCDTAPAVEPLADGIPSPLRAVMLEIDQLNWNIEPVVRLPEQFGAVESWARSIQGLVGNSAWDEYCESDSFLGNRPLFDSYKGWMFAGAQQLADGAKAGDVDIMRQGFIRLEMSCVACHKRYQPNM